MPLIAMAESADHASRVGLMTLRDTSRITTSQLILTEAGIDAVGA